ncbi:hypothetical protein HBB16_07540 [Pseudonocardia sp. MCCB 268]|nr:hypothetical protein [Pseudonocardia cytotoxica]
MTSSMARRRRSGSCVPTWSRATGPVARRRRGHDGAAARDDDRGPGPAGRRPDPDRRRGSRWYRPGRRPRGRAPRGGPPTRPCAPRYGLACAGVRVWMSDVALGTISPGQREPPAPAGPIAGVARRAAHDAPQLRGPTSTAAPPPRDLFVPQHGRQPARGSGADRPGRARDRDLLRS